MMTLPPILILFIFTLLPFYLAASSVQPMMTSSQSQGTTIPAFPEQADVVRCPLTLSDEHFNGIKTACGRRTGSNDNDDILHRSRCCPVLAAWLYSAYSATALSNSKSHTTSYEDMPLLPDDSETCETDLGKAFKLRGIHLPHPNDTCDLVYCYCGIRLHPFTCPESFSISPTGNLVGDQTVKRLEKNCLTTTTHVNGFPGLGGCNKCLHTLLLLRKKSSSNSSKSEERTRKIHNKDCELMGLTWLLAKNRKAYIDTITWVLRALMLSPDDWSDPQSCTLNSDGKPLAVDISDDHHYSFSIKLQPTTNISFFFTCIVYFILLLVSFI